MKQITGTEIHYYFVCKRKLWLFSRGISYEKHNEYIEIGNYIHDNYFNRNKKEVQIGPIKIDFFENTYEVIHEVKKSSKIAEAALWQLKYYIFYLKQFGMHATGQIHIPEEKKKISVELTEEDEQKLFDIIKDIQVILDSSKAPERLASGNKLLARVT